MKTKAAILLKQNQALVLDDIEIPILKNGQVLVRILASGICRSQLNEYQGLKGPDPYLPHLLGHEGAGIVEVTTPGVKKVKPGDYVVVTWIKGKGMEVAGTQYRWGERLVNSGALASLSEYAVISENRVVKISKKIMPAVAALLGCAIPTGGGMVFNTLNVKKGTSLAVFGVGGIGGAAILAARMSRCKTIIGVDVFESKLKFARDLGATHRINAREQDTSVMLKKNFPSGLDYAIESSGNYQAMEQAFSVIQDQGTLVIAGNLPKGQKIAIDPFDLIKGKRILGTWGGETVPDRDIPKYVRAYLSKKLLLEKLITHRFPFEKINQALSVLISGQAAGRIVIEF